MAMVVGGGNGHPFPGELSLAQATVIEARSQRYQLLAIVAGPDPGFASHS